MYIEKVNNPQDIKGLNINELNVLADEIRAGVLNRVSSHGGHVGPNLGFTEATVAMHMSLTPHGTSSSLTFPIRSILIRCLPAARMAFSRWMT